MDEITKKGYLTKFDDRVQGYLRTCELDREDILHLISFLPAHGTVLDIGCGPGTHAAIFEELGYHVVCADILPEMVNECLKKGLDASVEDARNMSFEDSSFTAVWSFASLLHLPREEFRVAIQEIWRVLKSDGILFLGLKSGSLEGYIGQGDERRYFRYWDVSELEKELQDLFEVVHIDLREQRGTSWIRLFARKLQ